MGVNPTCVACGTELDPTTAVGPTGINPCPTCGDTRQSAAVVLESHLLCSASLTGTIVLYHERLLSLADELIQSGDPSVAIVVCHMACEIATEKAFDRAFAARNVPDLEAPVLSFISGFNLASPKIRDLFNALIRKQIQNEFFWSDFKNSAERRNQLVHGGTIATEAEGRRFLAVCRELVAFLA